MPVACALLRSDTTFELYWYGPSSKVRAKSPEFTQVVYTVDRLSRRSKWERGCARTEAKLAKHVIATEVDVLILKRQSGKRVWVGQEVYGISKASMFRKSLIQKQARGGIRAALRSVPDVA